jgi:hypothetical protein
MSSITEPDAARTPALRDCCAPGRAAFLAPPAVDRIPAASPSSDDED